MIPELKGQVYKLGGLQREIMLWLNNKEWDLDRCYIQYEDRDYINFSARDLTEARRSPREVGRVRQSINKLEKRDLVDVRRDNRTITGIKLTFLGSLVCEEVFSYGPI